MLEFFRDIKDFPDGKSLLKIRGTICNSYIFLKVSETQYLIL